MDDAQKIALKIRVRTEQVQATIDLLDDGNTLPFIARYRKEATGGLDEEQIGQIKEGITRMRALDERRQAILKSIGEQENLTPELEKQLYAAETLTALEDLYRPYKPRRRSRASMAREMGLQGLADLILQQPPVKTSLVQLVKPFLNEQVPVQEVALSGARDIVAETISDHAEVRHATRQKALQFGMLHTEKIVGAADQRSVFETYYSFEFPVSRLRPHQVLAINRGEEEKVLRVRIDLPESFWRDAVMAVFRPNRQSTLDGQLELAIVDTAERLLLPAIERDVRRDLTEKAAAHAIRVFADNLRALLNQPPLACLNVLGIDPGFRTGSKVAVVDATGRLLITTTIYPHEPQKERDKALQELAALIMRYQVSLIAIGNGTASRETEQLVAELIRMLTPGVKYLITNEAGASVYSASRLARTELPGLDVSLRGAVSIARRVQDPLAELVKIDPKSIGVGLYQHDVEGKALDEALTVVVESVVNQVGVDLNTASPALLTYVAGIGPKLAEKIVAYRDANGAFANRASLRQVPALGPKAFEQSAGFLRIRDGDNPLDASGIHPESYPVAVALLRKAGLSVHSTTNVREPALEALLKRQAVAKLAGELGAGVPTVTDILEQLIRPGPDPRQDAPLPVLRSDVLSMDDLVVGMKLKGTVRNVVDFGAFIDIGVKQDGLLHRSQVPAGVLLKVGDVIEVIIQKVETERGRIALSWSIEK